MTGSVISRPLQKDFLNIPQTPLCYWLRPRFFELLAGKTLGDVADVVQGLATANDARFVRFVWEAPPKQYGLPVRSRRWVPFEKGGGYGKWFGHHWWVVDWEHNGARIKAFPASVVRNERYYFREGWTYTTTARGSLGLRRMCEDSIFAHKSSAVMPRSNADCLGVTLNCRVASYLTRGIRAQIDLSEDYVARVALPKDQTTGWCDVERHCVALKTLLTETDVTECSFSPGAVDGFSFLLLSAVSATLLAMESYAERQVFADYYLNQDDTAAVLAETGTPAGWSRLVAGYDSVTPLPDSLSLLRGQLDSCLADIERIVLPKADLESSRARLRILFEAGPGTASVEEDDAPERTDSDEEQEQVVLGTSIPIPTETFLEELSQTLEIHPISVYWLLKEGIEQEGWRCLPEERRIAAEQVTVMILRLLGHQWPTQIEGGEPVPEWADADGIVPLTGGTGEPTLLERLRERIAEDYDGDGPGSFERHFAEVSAKPLEQWIETEFFKYQLGLLRKRPIAWQIQSGRYAKKRKPAFACLVYFHKLDGDLLPKIRAQYVGPLRQKLETELRSIEEVPDRAQSERQDARRVELEELIAELKDFDDRLKEVMDKGFASAGLKELIGKERPDKWCSVDGELPSPVDKDALLLQEGRYLPDINDGVLVNIAPLQKAGLLAAEGLAKKDVEPAIADRAEWRSDERRWCRESKLPHPGWWQKGAADGS